MNRILRKDEQKILDELESIPDNELPKILEVIHYLKVGILSAQKEVLDTKLDPSLAATKGSNQEKKVENLPPYFSIQQMAE